MPALNSITETNAIIPHDMKEATIKIIVVTSNSIMKYVAQELIINRGILL